MATVRSQIDDKAKEVQVDAATASSVPVLRDQVVKLAEEVERLNKIVDRLVRIRRKP